MTSKIRGFLILNFLLSILVLSILISSVSAASDSSTPIYIQTSAGIEKASFDDLTEILFNHNFKIEKKTEVVPDEKCSLRAEAGSLEIDGKIFDKNDLSFFIPLTNGLPGQGELTAKKDKESFSLKFDLSEILETNSERIVFRAKGEGKLNKQKLNFDNIIVTYDKINNKVKIIGTGDKNFTAKNLQVTFTKWCSEQKTTIYLITDKGILGKSRTMEEVKELLKQYPAFINAYEGLRNLNENDIPAIIPEFSTMMGVLTLLGAVAVFFVIRKK